MKMMFLRILGKLDTLIREAAYRIQAAIKTVQGKEETERK